jgi:hypothetical protein
MAWFKESDYDRDHRFVPSSLMFAFPEVFESREEWRSASGLYVERTLICVRARAKFSQSRGSITRDATQQQRDISLLFVRPCRR